ncbi:Rad1/Rec1/Rad17 [Kickxella alabastrina]|uniref:Rad1/Rec1/Rad17 n=1 Tax=Kickxella alabastrina TaxID=61397 RepID=UPI002220B70B|nr:Rad1/Rec1/Rad17 [Kickxella alabastrina]KAI7833699.1 Rad1/Rec1/Rad17 [Kickxella alabastrina]
MAYFSPSAPSAAQELQEPLFRAKLNNIRPLVNMLRTIGFCPRARCTISTTGLVFDIDEAQAMVAQAFIRTELFTTYKYNTSLAMASIRSNSQQEDDDEEEKCIPLDNLIECLMLFYGPGSGGGGGGGGIGVSSLHHGVDDLRGATTVELGFDGPGGDFQVLLEERGPNAQSTLTFRNAFNELDPTSDSISISISAHEPYFRIATVGNGGSTEMTYARDERVLDSYFCNEEVENRFKLGLVLRCRSALGMSEKTKVRVNRRGFLCLQFMVPTVTEQSFVNFVFAPLVATDDDAQR